MFRNFFFFLLILILLSIFCNRNNEIKNNEKYISKERAIKTAQKYLKIKNTKMFEIIIESGLITNNSINTYKQLKRSLKRLCWVIHFNVPDAVGATRTVYVDKINGEILGGYSSK